MKYKIFRLVEPEVLSYIDNSGYDNRIKKRITLEKVQGTWESKEEFDTEQEARDYVMEHEEQFRHGSYAIILTF